MTNIRHPTIRFLVIVTCFLICLGFVRSLWDTWGRGEQISQRRTVLKGELEKNSQLSQQLEEATSSAFVEREARNKLGLTRDGETIILMGTPAPGDTESQNVVQTHLTRWQQWWGLFF